MKFIKTELAKKLEEERLGLDFTPRRGTAGSAGFDLCACIEHYITIFPDEVVKIPTGVKIWIGSEDYFKEYADDCFTLVGELLPRSSTNGAVLNNTVGVVDWDYQGEIFIKLRNITTEAVTIKSGEAFAQVLFKPVYIPREMKEVSEFGTVTDRAEGGFGSTNKPEEQPDTLGR